MTVGGDACRKAASLLSDGAKRWLRSFLISGLLAVVWICAALFVAFPVEATNSDYGKIAHEFITGSKRAFLLLLFFVDALIDFIVGDMRHRFKGKQRPVYAILAVVAYIFICFGIAPHHKDASSLVAHFTWGSLIALWVLRTASYLPPPLQLKEVGAKSPAQLKPQHDQALAQSTPLSAVKSPEG